MCVLHQNDSFTLFGKFCLKTGMHTNFYFIAAIKLATSEDLASNSVFIIT